MQLNRPLQVVVLLAALAASTRITSAMNSNLATPYSDKCSPPQTPYLSFYSPQSADLLFDKSSLSRKHELDFICQAGLRSSGLTWSLHRNLVKKPLRQGQAEALPANQFRISIDPSQLPPGFYDLRVVLDSGLTSSADPKDKRPVTGVCTFGWQASKMAICDNRPADFKAFWDKAKAKLAAIPLDARDETPPKTFNQDQIDAYNLSSAALPADYDPSGHKVEEVESWKISFVGPDGGRVYAWLAKPKGPGPFPAMLILPGAGFAARPRPLEHARHGYLAIDIQIHGQDVDLPDYPKLPGYYSDPQYSPAEAFYYYNVHLRVLQAINYLATRPDVDTKRIVVAGGSQGGRLGIVAAGLDSRVRAVVSCIANSPNYPHQLWVARCNGLDSPADNPNDPKFKGRPTFDGMDLTGAPPAPDDEAGRCLAYYDPMNFAPDTKCPVLMNGGLVDGASPPFSVWAVFNRLKVKDKTLVPLPGLGHDWSAEFDRRAWRWLDERLKQ